MPNVTKKPSAKPNSQLETEAWVSQFWESHGRAPRVLHIGNIANNAYNNACIQRKYGIEASVLSFDYYHIMATPEWEDANFDGEIVDVDFPDWWSVNLNGFVRPRWFVAAPLDISIRYLLAEISGSPSRHLLWRCANFERWLLCRKNWSCKLVRAILTIIFRRPVQYLVCPAQGPGALLLGRALALSSSIAGALGIRAGRLRKLSGRLRRSGRAAMAAQDVGRKILARRYQHHTLATLNMELRELGRSDQTTDLTHLYQWWCHPLMRLLFDRFDVIQAYSTYTALPFIIGHRDYVAYEHGTIREIPFLETDEGRMCAASYRSATTVFITNTDNIVAAERLKLSPSSVICLPHAFDSEKLLHFAAEKEDVRPDAASTVRFLTPTRQHWKDTDPSLAKGNDRVFHALREIKERGLSCHLRAVAWGRDLDFSKALIRELGIEDMVEWLKPMKKHELWLSYLESHAVIDQFIAPAIGGVTFEAMILGRRVITHLNTYQNETFFSKAPPVLMATSIEEIIASLTAVINDPSDSVGIGVASQKWMQQYHSARRIMSLQAKAYETITLQTSDRQHTQSRALDPRQ